MTGEDVCFGRVALSRDGRYLAAVTAGSHVKLRFWDLQSPDVDIQVGSDPDSQTNRLLREKDAWISLPDEEASFLEFNPFNHTLLVVGSERNVTVVTVTAATSFQIATLTPQTVQLDYSNLNQCRVLSTLWLNDRQLLLSTRGGEILSCSMRTPPSVLAIREREMAAQQAAAAANAQMAGVESPASGGHTTPSGMQVGSGSNGGGEIELSLTHMTNSDLSLLGLVDSNVDPRSSRYELIDWKNEEGRGWTAPGVTQLPVSTWMGSLPAAPTVKEEDEEDEDDEREEKEAPDNEGRYHSNNSNNTAIALCMALTRHEVVVGTNDGCLLWLHKQSQQVTHQQQIDAQGGYDGGVITLSFSPSYATFVAMTRRGQLRLFKPLSDRAAPSPSSAAAALHEGGRTGASQFQTSSLGFFPSFRVLSPAPALVSHADNSLPRSLLAGREGVRCGHVLIPIPPSELNHKNFRLLNYTSNGFVQIWCYGTRQLLASYRCMAGVRSATCSPDGHLGLVGLENGVVNIFDLSNPSFLRLIFSERLHSGPVLDIQFNKDGDLFATMGACKVLFMRPTDFKLVAYTKIQDWKHEERMKTSMNVEEVKIQPDASPVNEEKTPSEERAAELASVVTSRTASTQQDEADATAASIKAEQAKYDDEPEVPVSLDSPGLESEPVADTIVAMTWSTPADREKLPNDRLIVATSHGYLISMTAPNVYHEHELETSPKLSTEFLQPVPTKLPTPVTSLQANWTDRTVIYATSTNKMLHVLQLEIDGSLTLTRSLNNDAATTENSEEGEDVEEVGTDGLLHQRPCTTLAQALTGNLVVSSGADGIILLRHGDTLEYLTRFPVHDFIVGGTCNVSISPDSSLLVTSGYDGSLLVWSLSSLSSLISTRRTRKLKSLPPVISVKVLETLQNVEENEEGEGSISLLERTIKSMLGSNADTKLKEKDLQQKFMKDELQQSLHTFKLQFEELLNRNNKLPEIERLGYKDFVIDLELEEALRQAGERRVTEMRQAIHDECVGKELVLSRIRKQCWDAMEVKGSMLAAFRADHDVHNFPIRASTPKENRRLRQIQFLRKMEIVEKRWRHNQQLKANEEEVIDRNFHPEKFTEDATAYIMNLDMEKDPEGTGKEGKASEDKKGGAKETPTNTARVATGGKGGHGAASPLSPGLSSPSSHKQSASVHLSVSDMPIENLPRYLLFHPLDVITPIRKRIQVLLVSVRINDLKRAFNETFNEFHQLKLREMEHIHEKAKRIQEIQSELQIMDQPVYKPVLAPEEIPHSVLTVDDSEIHAPKVLSKAERAIAEAKAERERKARESEDDGPTRALDVMMGGTLEKKRDLSLLEQELQPEEWMKTLTPEEMSDEQKAELAKFEKKVQLIQLEQETRRKLLQTELSKLKSDVTDICKNFDNKLKNQLVDHRIAVQRDVYQHELIIIKLVLDMAASEEKEKEEQMVMKKVHMLQQAQSTARELLQEFERTYRSSQSAYESMQMELKNMDRQFRKDLQNGGVSAEAQAAAQVAASEAMAQYDEAVQQAAAEAIANGDIDEQGNPILPPIPEPEPIPPSLIGAGESLEYLYKLFRQRVVKGVGGAAGSKKKMSRSNAHQVDSITGRTLRTGSNRISLLGALTPDTPSDMRRSGRDGSVAGSGAAAVRSKRRKGDSEEDAGDGTMNPYPSDLLQHLQHLYTAHAASIAPGPNPQLLEDVKYLELDDRDKPESVSMDLWYALLDRRAEYIEKERDMRRYHYKLQEMAMHLQHLRDMDVALNNELRHLAHYHQQLLDARTLFSLNTELMVRIQQGQVELNESPVVTDLAECEMIDRSWVEQLNAVIRTHGSEKVAILKDTTVSRTAINLLEWTRQKLDLEYADSVDLTTELQLLRVTKSLQGLIKMGGHDNQKAAELKSLDRKIEFVASANRDSMMSKKLQLMKVRKKIKQQSRENERLYETVQELEAAVKERMQISAIRDEGRMAESRAGAARMQSIVTRRKLVDLAKLQSEEIQFLRGEVEKLRRKTFASFAIPPIQPNPDEKHQPPTFLAAQAAAARLSRTSSSSIGGRVPTSLPQIRASSAGTRQ